MYIRCESSLSIFSWCDNRVATPRTKFSIYETTKELSNERLYGSRVPFRHNCVHSLFFLILLMNRTQFFYIECSP